MWMFFNIKKCPNNLFLCEHKPSEKECRGKKHRLNPYIGAMPFLGDRTHNITRLRIRRWSANRGRVSVCKCYWRDWLVIGLALPNAQHEGSLLSCNTSVLPPLPLVLTLHPATTQLSLSGVLRLVKSPQQRVQQSEAHCPGQALCFLNQMSHVHMKGALFFNLHKGAIPSNRGRVAVPGCISVAVSDLLLTTQQLQVAVESHTCGAQVQQIPERDKRV